MHAARIALCLLSLLFPQPVLAADLSGTYLSPDNAALLRIAALPQGFTHDYIVSFSTSMDAATGICLGEGLATYDEATGELLVTLDGEVSLLIRAETTDTGLVLRIDQDPGPYCGMGATIIGIFEQAQ